MRTLGIISALCTVCVGLVAFSAGAASVDDQWPAWRGPNATGAAVNGNPPITWSETENIKWKVPMVDSGDGTPIIWGDKIFLQTAIALADDPGGGKKPPSKEEAGREIFTRIPTVPWRFGVMCLDRNTGKTLWEQTILEEIPHEGFHPSASLSNYSPVTDGKLLWVSFGSRGLHCYDVDGNHKWSADLPQLLTFRGFGEGSSPALAGDAVIVVADHEGESKILVFNKNTGDLLWEKDREETTTWATPLPVLVDGKYQIVTSGSNFVRSYDLATGDIVWQCAGLLPGAIPSPVFSNGKVYCMTGYQKYSLLAIELGHTGDLTDTDAIAWSLEANTPYVPSPLLYNDRLYFSQGMRAVLSCYDAETGEALYEKQKLEGLAQIYGSPVGAGGRIYLSDRKGNTIVIKQSDTFEVLATNTLDEGFDASPVVIGDELYLKGQHHLYCIANQ